jgi:methylglutaconyl-CoA hydratase
VSEELVRLSVDGGVATVTLASPYNRNALSSGLVGQLGEHLQTAISNDAVRVIVLTGDGPVFCSGADLKERAQPAPSGGASGPGGLVGVLKTILDSPKPIVARVNGPTRAGGIGLIAACDIAVAVEEATFAFSEVRIGVIPAMISVVCVPKLGAAKSMELFLTGDTFSAEDAAGYGLINQAVPAAALDAAVGAYVSSIMKGAPGALAGAKRLVRDVPGMSIDEAFEETAKRSAEFFGSEEAREGIAAFVQKRPPRWAEDA